MLVVNHLKKTKTSHTKKLRLNVYINTLKKAFLKILFLASNLKFIIIFV